jgi:hypothetical protein
VHILHLELSNAKDFDRGCRNPKSFPFEVCADSCVLSSETETAANRMTSATTIGGRMQASGGGAAR